MSSRIATVLAVVAALLFGATGYLYGVNSGGVSQADIDAGIETYLNAHPALLASAASPPATVADELGESQIAAVQDLIRDHLLANPEIIRDAINELQRREAEEELVAQATMISDDKDRIFESSHQVVLGNPDGDVTLVEFFDYNCGYCKRAHADMKKLIDEDKNLRVVLKEFPVLGEGSVEAAQVSIAVRIAAPEMAADFHDTLLLDRGQVNGARALAVAEDMGLDMAKIREAMASDEVKATIDESYELADSLSLTGTPSYVTAKEVVVGAVGFDTLKAKIDDARACATASC